MSDEKSLWFRVNSIRTAKDSDKDVTEINYIPDDDEFIKRSPAEHNAIFVGQVPSGYDQIKDQGRKAYTDGKGISDNPYADEEAKEEGEE